MGSRRKFYFVGETFTDHDEIIAERWGCSISAVRAERRRRGIQRFAPRPQERYDAPNPIYQESRVDNEIRLHQRVAELLTRVHELHRQCVEWKIPVPEPLRRMLGVTATVDGSSTAKKTEHLLCHYSGAKERCHNLGPILATGNPSPVCVVHASRATKVAWAQIERAHGLPNIYPTLVSEAWDQSKPSLSLVPSTKPQGEDPDALHIREGRQERLLDLLKRERKIDSEKLQAKLDVPRRQLWKDIHALRALGHNIPHSLSGTVTFVHYVESAEKSEEWSSQEEEVEETAPVVVEPEPLLPEASKPEKSAKSLVDVVPSNIRWFWNHRIPLGALTVIYGKPGDGKGTLTAALVAAETRGRALPADDRLRAPGNVLFVVAEDDASSVLRPRMQAADADVSRIRVFERDIGIRLPQDVATIEAEIVASKATLVVIDPLRGLLNGDSRRQVRDGLAALEAAAARTGAAVVVVHHTNKKGDVLGSQDIVGIPRSLLIVSGDEDFRTVAQAKTNLAPDAAPIRFRIVDKGGVGAVEWLPEKIVEAEDGVTQMAELPAPAQPDEPALIGEDEALDAEVFARGMAAIERARAVTEALQPRAVKSESVAVSTTQSEEPTAAVQPREVDASAAQVDAEVAPVVVRPSPKTQMRRRCACCNRSVFGKQANCINCEFCKLVEGVWVPDAACPRERAKTLRPVVVEEVAAEMEQEKAKKTQVEDRTAKNFRPKYEPF